MGDATAATAKLFGPGGMMEIVEEEILHKFSSLETQPSYQTSGLKYRVYKRSPFGLTLPELFAYAAKSYQTREFMVYEDIRVSYAEAFSQVQAVGAALVNDYGVQKGDRVAISMRNYPEWCIAFMAATTIGAIAVPVNSLWNGDELEYGMHDSGTKVIFVDQERLKLITPLLDGKCPGLTTVIGCRLTSAPSHPKVTTYETMLAGAAGMALPVIKVEQDDDATLFYTSGTTGNPKGVLSTHRAIMSAINTLGVRSAGLMAAGKGEPKDMPQQVALTPVPLFHVTGSHAIFLNAVLNGSKLVLMFKWDVIQAL